MLGLDFVDAPDVNSKYWVMAGVCWWLFTAVLCFSDFPCDSNALIPKVPNLSIFLHKMLAGFKLQASAKG